MIRATSMIVALALSVALQACSQQGPNTAKADLGSPSIEPLPLAVTPTGTDIQVKLETPAYAAQYVSGDIAEIVVGLYDSGLTGNPVDPDSSRRFAFALGGILKTDGQAAVSMLGQENPLPYFGAIRALVDQAADTGARQNGRYMIRHLTKAGGGFTTPTNGGGVTFYNIPDGTYKLFAAAVKNGVFIARDVQDLAFDASNRVFYQGNTGASYVDPAVVPTLCLKLDPNPDVQSEVGLHDSESKPGF